MRDLLVAVTLLASLPDVVGVSHSVNWVIGLGGDVSNEGSLSAVSGDSVSLSWSGGHNLYMSEGGCGVYTSVEQFKNASSYTQVEASYPGQNPYTLSVPSVTSVTSFCYACITHYDSMRFTLQVSPSVNDVVCIDDSIGVQKHGDKKDYVPLSSVRVGDRLATPTGSTVVRGVVTQEVHDGTWSVPAGMCGATEATTLSPSHAIRCNGVWTSAKEVGAQTTERRTVRYVNLLTDDYCSDMLILETGLVVETWDGRKRNEWRPHSYEDGQRVNCRRSLAANPVR